MPKGTPQEFLAALDDKLAELNDIQTIGSSEDIDVDSAELEPIYGEYDESYFEALMDLVEIHSPIQIGYWYFGTDELCIDAYAPDPVTFTIPFADLTYNVTEDSHYILDALKE